MSVLNNIADKMKGAHRLTVEDEGLLALAQGWAHATTHSIFFYYRCLIHICCTSAHLHVSTPAMQMTDLSNWPCPRTASQTAADAAREAGSRVPQSGKGMTCISVHAVGCRST